MEISKRKKIKELTVVHHQITHAQVRAIVLVNAAVIAATIVHAAKKLRVAAVS